MNYRPTVTTVYLDKIKEKHDIQSDYKLAEFLGIGRSLMSSYRTGRTGFDDFMCHKIADALDLPFELVLAEVNYERDNREEAKQFWKEYAEKISARATLAVTSIALLFSLNGFSSTVQAMEGLSCILC